MAINPVSAALDICGGYKDLWRVMETPDHSNGWHGPTTTGDWGALCAQASRSHLRRSLRASPVEAQSGSQLGF